MTKREPERREQSGFLVIQLADPARAIWAVVSGEPDPSTAPLGRLDAGSRAIAHVKRGRRLCAHGPAAQTCALNTRPATRMEALAALCSTLGFCARRPRRAWRWITAQRRGAWLFPVRMAFQPPAPSKSASAPGLLPGAEAVIEAARDGNSAAPVSWDVKLTPTGTEACWPPDTELLARHSDLFDEQEAGTGGPRLHLPVTLGLRPDTPLQRRRAIPQDGGGVSVIVPTRDQPRRLAACLASLREGLRPQDELILVDHRTQDAEALALIDQAEADGARIVREGGPFNFSRLINAGAQHADRESLVLVNNDVSGISPDFASVLAGWLNQERVGVVGVDLRYPGGRRQHVGLALNEAGRPGHIDLGRRGDGPLGLYRLPREVYAVTGAMMALRRSLFDAAGGMDEALAQDFNDVALCLAARQAGLKTVWTPDVRAIHAESATRGRAGEGRGETAWRHVTDRFGALATEDPYFPDRNDRARLRWRMRRMR